MTGKIKGIALHLPWRPSLARPAQGKKERRSERERGPGLQVCGNMGRAQFASFFLEVASTSTRSPFFLEVASSSPRSPMSPFSAVAPSRFICVSRQQVHLTLDTIAEEDGGDHGDGSSKQAKSSSSARFSERKRAMPGYA